ncbi:MAG: uroporphyrinogen decarboxylase family protein [Candidatus Bathyarchaeia archaeon]
MPIDIGGGASTSISIEGYERIKQYLGVRAEPKVLNKAFRVARLDEIVMERLGSDCRPIVTNPPSEWKRSPSKEGTFVDVWGITWKQVHYAKDCYYWEVTNSPLAEAEIEDLERYPWPNPLDAGYTVGLADEVRQLHARTDYAFMADGGFKSFWEIGYMLRGFSRMLIDMKRNPEFVSALMSKLLEINIAGTGQFLEAVGRYIQVIRAGDDLASQTGPIMSPQLFREILKPVYKTYFNFIKSKTSAKIFFHSCGNIVDLIEDLVDTGVEIINPVQVSAMPDTAALKSRFGEKVVFWGGIGSQHILPHGSVDEVGGEVRRRIHDLGPKGGFVLAAVHNIQPDVSPQNIIAMVDAARQYGTYPVNAQ